MLKDKKNKLKRCSMCWISSNRPENYELNVTEKVKTLFDYV